MCLVKISQGFRISACSAHLLNFAFLFPVQIVSESNVRFQLWPTPAANNGDYERMSNFGKKFCFDPPVLE